MCAFLNANLTYLYKSKRKRSRLSLGSLIKHFPPCVNHGGKGTVIGRRIPSVPLSCKITSDYLFYYHWILLTDEGKERILIQTLVPDGAHHCHVDEGKDH